MKTKALALVCVAVLAMPACGGTKLVRQASAPPLAGPALVGMGIARAVNNHKVGDRIETRATALPATVSAGAEASLDLFFPVSPSPRHVTVRYSDATGDHQLVIDTTGALAGLHLAAEDAGKRQPSRTTQ